MHQQKHFRQTGRIAANKPALLLLSAAALLAALVVAGWGSARAAPQSGAPSLSILSISGATLTLQFTGWTTNEIINLSYSTRSDCSIRSPLPNNNLSAESNNFQATYDWPSSGIPAGSYYLCATATEGSFASPQPITVESDGTIQLGSGAPGPTATPGGPKSTPTSASTPTPTQAPGAAPSATASGSGGGNGGSGGPGNGGASSSSPGSSASALIAIILLCVLVLALLAYLIRLWLQGRQTGGQPPVGGGQQTP